MDTHTKKTWWESYRETIKVSKRFHELVSLVDDREDIARNMVNLAKEKYPDKAEIWYVNKLITELKTKRIVSFA